MGAQFSVKRACPKTVARLSSALGLPRFIAATLATRGIDTPEQAVEFMNPSLERDWRNPYEIPGLSEVADVVGRAIDEHRHIVVFGDFDLDGISATTVLTRGLRALGAKATPFIPRRFDEGYGITQAAYQRVKQLNPDLVVTVDCGIACREEVAAIVADGVEVAVTDHHEAADLVPEGVPVADPKMGEGCKSSILAGVGVALKLVQVLGARRGYPHLWRSYTDLATLGTVADLMPMRGENRALVAEGLKRINENPRPCIAALLGICGPSAVPVTATNITYSMVPRLNAAGRMGDAQLALDLLMSDSYPDACALAQRLDEVNTARRTIEAELSEKAQAQAAETYHGQRALVVAGEGWHEGVKGIVASRLVNRYGVPAILFTVEGDEARGSGRSVGSVNLFAAVESCSDLLTRFGGHEAAVGITLPTANLEAFAERLCAYMDQLPEGAFHPLVQIDALVALPELSIDTVRQLEALAPFGQDNQVPCYMARNVTLVNPRAVGADKNHFSCGLTDGRVVVAGIMFHCDDIDELMANEGVVDAAFTLQVDEWRGRFSVKAMLKALAPARTCCALRACLNPEAQTLLEGLYAEDDQQLCADAVAPDPAVAEGAMASVKENRAKWEAVARENPDGLEQALITALIGQRPLHQSQREVLDQLRAGKSTFAVMATGRGKSLTFTVYAAMMALSSRMASVFVYPLRALIADQAFHLASSLLQFGITCAVLNGESTRQEREEAWEGLKTGGVDIVLTTPEFFVLHADEFAESGRVGFVVVDEAHHIGLAKAGQRTAYTQLGMAIAKLGNPTVLALTATAPDNVAGDIDAQLPLQERVIDSTCRDNLRLDDQRNIRNRDDYLANIIASGEKTVVYVNSREQSVALARLLRKKVPQLAPLIGFYNAGLSRAERKRIEELFRNNDLLVLVATSAFGEGVDIPNIRHVVLYHLPFNEVEFNQMSGRAGRDGNPATIHLLFGQRDIAINEGILREATPDHDVMAQVYRQLRQRQRQQPGNPFPLDPDDLAAQASAGFKEISPASVACGLKVFTELGLIDVQPCGGPGAPAAGGSPVGAGAKPSRPAYIVRVNEGADRVELTDSVRYSEGMGERSIFDAFRAWALASDSQGLTIRVSHPIVPGIFPPNW